ncbi:MAG: NAD(P)-dependent oxidoreductase [Gammaproteobacteria bacterium]|nr:NAD(P)-dependent oxidoreductase [Gammaproteobacteria bacterium]
MQTLVIGLGSMGFGAAVSCVRAGIDTAGFDVNPEALERFQASGGKPIESLAACKDIDCVLVFVVNASQAESVLFDSGLQSSLTPNALIINCVTLAPSKAVEIANKVGSMGFRYIDAPVSGGAARALGGRMSIMASGTPLAMTDAKPIFDAISEHVFELGDEPGQGSQMKLINQLLAGVHIAATAEAMNLAASLDMDLHQVIDVISKCAGSSWMFENRAPHIADGDYSPLSSVNIFVKDLGIVTNEAVENSVVTPLSDAALALYRKASESGLGGEDDSAVVKVLAQQSKVTLPGSDT